MFKKWGMLGIGWFLTISGAIITPLPPPFAFGFVLLGIGLFILSSRSRFVRRAIQKARDRYPGFSKRMEAVRPRLPRGMHGLIEHTSPRPFQRLRRRQHHNRTQASSETEAA